MQGFGFGSYLANSTEMDEDTVKTLGKHTASIRLHREVYTRHANGVQYKIYFAPKYFDMPYQNTIVEPQRGFEWFKQA